MHRVKSAMTGVLTGALVMFGLVLAPQAASAGTSSQQSWVLVALWDYNALGLRACQIDGESRADGSTGYYCERTEWNGGGVLGRVHRPLTAGPEPDCGSAAEMTVVATGSSPLEPVATTPPDGSVVHEHKRPCLAPVEPAEQLKTLRHRTPEPPEPGPRARRAGSTHSRHTMPATRTIV